MSWELVKGCVAPIQTVAGEIRGTGFYISPQGHLLTCAHVLETAGGWEHVRIRGEGVTLVCRGNEARDDFAILQTPGYQGDCAPLGVRYAPLDRFLTIGFGRPDFPYGASIDGTITDTNPQGDFGDLPMLRLRIKANSQRVQAGFSGAPVFNADNQTVVGIVAAYDNTEGALAVPIATVAEKWPRLLNHLASTAPNKIERALAPARVFISYRSEDPDLSLAQTFYESLRGAGHNPFMAGESLRLGEDWPSRIGDELEQSDYFLLLLSSRSATSDMVTEEVRRAKQLHDLRADKRPRFLPIRVNLPWSEPLNYDLAGYLSRFQQRGWSSADDTPAILQEILDLVREGKESGVRHSVPPPPAVDTPDRPPLPIAEPELPEGQVAIASVFYVSRPPIESNCFREIEKPGALIHIKAPRQMGKTSLMARILSHAREKNFLATAISFQLANGNILSDLKSLLRWFCVIVGKKLNLQPALETHWMDLLDDKSNCTAYFDEYVLPSITAPLALGLDEADRLLEHPGVAEEFLGLLRGWHELAKDQDVWRKLRLVVVHSTESYVNLDVNQSPFNVGLPVKLVEFDLQQVRRLTRQHGLAWSDPEITALMKLVGGHPYLVRVALYYVARQEVTLGEFLTTAPTEAGNYSDHLRRHLWILQQYPALSRSMRAVVLSHGPVRIDSEDAFKLESMGLLKRSQNNVTVSCDLYRQYFADRLKAF
jgi:hypothetical protein